MLDFIKKLIEDIRHTAKNSEEAKDMHDSILAVVDSAEKNLDVLVQKTEEDIFKEVAKLVQSLNNEIKKLGCDGSVTYIAKGNTTYAIDSGLDDQSLVNLTAAGQRAALNYREKLAIDAKQKEAEAPLHEGTVTLDHASDLAPVPEVVHDAEIVANKTN